MKEIGMTQADAKEKDADSRALSPAAQRALAEAAERRAAIDARAAKIAERPETLGRGGLEPVRYEDWEVKGLASDF
ncbi:MAG: DUF1674 domain-containing protein [Methylorubrum extorquens]|jgi:hypothetical protein|uniref:DUF1674 domain-containing protein n=1 Tax=Methylorubrum extorquens (strain DSM 6343 / CIP 106787 / DM4) TaxID=661410 RepID=C7CAF4_METED|nr:DUF1674 domain-containing protein [Methylorubrum extorquens]UYW26762.1 DUF1674 domain-containing protein [Methylorubrum extorquens]UYW33368.1 DUF1674 domain-containing protein [Methylorubrum extorquens]CAX22179.1 conserved protein of unknown function [Methylorubrum extorquens DM4]